MKNEITQKSVIYDESDEKKHNDLCASDSHQRNGRIDSQIGRFGNRLKTIIGDESVTSFAKRCGISEGALRNLLRGNSSPRLDNVIKISDISGVNIKWLATGYGPMYKTQPEPPKTAPNSTNQQSLVEYDEEPNRTEQQKQKIDKLIEKMLDTTYNGTIPSVANINRMLAMLLLQIGDLNLEGMDYILKTMNKIEELHKKTNENQ